MYVCSSLSRVQLCSLKDCSLPSSSVHGILRVRILVWVAISFSRGSSQPRIEPRSPTLQADSLSSEPIGKPICKHRLQCRRPQFYSWLWKLPWRRDRLPLQYSWVSLVAQLVRNPPAIGETWGRSLGWEDSLEEGMATHSNILAWRIPKDRGAWRAAVHRVRKSWTRLSD